MDEVLVITKIRFEEEIRSTTEVKLKGEKTISSKELEIGMALIAQYSGDFDISSFKDEHRVELLAIIKAKAKGKQPIIKKMQPKTASSDDLYSQLMESLTKKKRA
jgi:DNA end-binding protein Ku